MGLRRRLQLIGGETLQDLELAAERRYREGVELIARGHPAGGIYLMGYVAEMVLKYAYFRYVGARPSDRVTPRLGPARARGRILIPGILDESYHSLEFWSRLLRAERQRDNRPLQPEIDAPFVQRTRRLHQNWWVHMRYLPDHVQDWELRCMRADVGWLRKQRLQLWR
jgi:hypothetical protein